ncbi:MAG: response regulator, partial [Pseudomonadota bacterium]
IEEASFELDAVAKQSVDFVARAAHEKGLELMIRVDPALPREVVGDFGRLRQVVTNLVANAVKFTPEGEVAIDLSREGDDDGAPRLRIEVADTGVGVPAEKIDAIFDEFSQVDGSETRRHTGTGLGLAICKGLVDLMGGRVGVSSEVGLGSVFWVSLPLRAADGAAAPGDAPRADEPRLDGARCLVVDDHERHREILGEILDGGGASVELAASAREAAKRLDAAAADGRPFDLVAIDGDMPGASGADLVRGLREEGRLKAARVLMLDPAGGETSAAEDVDGRIDKPTTPALLRAAAAQALASGAATNPTGPAPARGATTPAEATPSILLIEDNDVNRIVVTEALDLIGRSAWLAVDGAEGVAAYMKHRPKTVLMDLSMPVLDGIGATKEIRRLEALHGLPRARIVAVTAHAAPSDRARCLEAGMDAYLAKPFAVKDLYAVLRDENGDALDISAA